MIAFYKREIAAKARRKAVDCHRIGAFPTLVWIAFDLAAHEPGNRLALVDEALAAAQRASQTSAGVALAQMATRFANLAGRRGAQEVAFVEHEQTDIAKSSGARLAVR